MRSLVNLVVALCVSLHAVFGCCLHHGHSADSQDCTSETHCCSEHDEHSERAGDSEHAWNSSNDRDGADGDRPSPSAPADCSRPGCSGPECSLATHVRLDDSEPSQSGPSADVPTPTFDRPSPSGDRPRRTSYEVDRPPAALRRHLLCQVLLI